MFDDLSDIGSDAPVPMSFPGRAPVSGLAPGGTPAGVNVTCASAPPPKQHRSAHKRISLNIVIPRSPHALGLDPRASNRFATTKSRRAEPRSGFRRPQLRRLAEPAQRRTPLQSMANIADPAQHHRQRRVL